MLWRACGCQSPTPGDNLFLLRSNNWAFRVCHSSELVKRLFAVHPGAPDGLDSPCSSSGAARFTLQAFSSSCTFKLFFWQLLCIRAPRLNLAGEAREEGWGKTWQTPQLTGGSSEPELNSAICIHPKKNPQGRQKHLWPSAPTSQNPWAFAADVKSNDLILLHYSDLTFAQHSAQAFSLEVWKRSKKPGHAFVPIKRGALQASVLLCHTVLTQGAGEMLKHSPQRAAGPEEHVSSIISSRCHHFVITREIWPHTPTSLPGRFLIAGAALYPHP